MFKPKTPGKNRQKDYIRKWTYNPVPCGSQHKGFLAGKPFGVYVHFVNRLSVPCRQEMSDGGVFCKHCEAGLVPDWRGYTPYYDEQYTPNFVLVTYPYYESVCEIEHLACVVVKRGRMKTDPVVITNSAWRTTPIPFSKERVEPVDLADFLLRVLWKDEPLMEWVQKQKYKAPVAPEPVTMTDMVKDHGLANMQRLMDRERQEKDAVVHAGDLAGNVMADLLTPKANGKPAFKRATPGG